jgi:benzoyl-CoA reductase/2-hydroxyglutaryl-CoA dehydratase subunit BcrC/BadD/HgdB
MVNMSTPVEKKDPIATIVKTCNLLGRIQKSKPSDQVYYRLMVRYYDRLLKAKEQGHKVAAHTIFFPVELLYALDFIPMHMEITSWMMALFTGSVAGTIAKAAEHRLASEICSAHRLFAGAMWSGELPRADLVVWSNMVCDSSFKSGNHYMTHNGIPGYFLEYPFQQTEAEKKYLRSDLEELVAFLEKEAGRKLAPARLDEVMAESNRQLHLLREIDELRKHRPSPFGNQDFLKLMNADCLFSGSPDGTEYLTALRDDLRQMVKDGRGAVPHERFRILTLCVPPMRLMSMIDKTCAEHGAVSVADPFIAQWGDFELDAPDPLDKVAQKLANLPEMCMWGPLDDRARVQLQQSARDHQADGALYYCQLGCGQTGATVKFIKDALGEIDIPLLPLNFDIVESTSTNEEELRQELERFFEFLGDR